MHAPRRSHAAPLLTSAPACAASRISGEPSCSDRHQLNTRSSYHFPVDADKHGRDDRHPQRISRTSTTQSSPRTSSRRRQISPHALWRPPAPRPMPAAAVSLLPCISTSSSSLAPSRCSRLQRQVGQRRTVSPSSGSAAAATSLEPTRLVLSQPECNNADDNDKHYNEVYDRLLFSPIHPSCADFTAAPSAAVEDEGDSSAGNTVARGSLASPDHENRCSKSTSLRNQKNSTLPGFITASKAAAALERLPELPTCQRGEAKFSRATAPISARAADAPRSPSPTLLSCSRTATAIGDDGVIPQPEAWWSALDGTLSATNTLLADESKRLYRGTETEASDHLLPSQTTPSLNETLGRADRAAIALSMRLSAHTGSVSGETVTSRLVRANDGRTTKSEEATAAAVTALAMRLSRATAGGSLSGAASTMLSDTSARGAGQNTLQALRDTMRLTQPLSKTRNSLNGTSAPSWLDMPEEGSGQLFFSDRGGKPSSTGTASVSQRHRRVAEDVTNSHGTQDDGVGVIKKGRVAPRIDSASARPYVRGRARASALGAPSPSSEGGVSSVGPLADSADGRRTLKTMRGLGPVPPATSRSALNTSKPLVGFTTDTSTGAREGAGEKDSRASVASHGLLSLLHLHTAAAADSEAPLTFQWNTEALTLRAIQNRHGSLTALHTLQRRRSHGNDRFQRPSSAGRPARGGHSETLASSSSSVASSVPTSVLSAVSLTSSIFNRELGESVAARKRFAKMRYKPATLRQSVISAPSDVAPESQLTLPQGMSSKEAAAEAYWQEQVRLYARHLVTPSKLPTDESVAAEQSLLDVDSLFKDAKHDSVDITAKSVHFSDKPCSVAISNRTKDGAAPASAPAGDAVATTGEVRASKPAAVGSPSLNALDRALQSRATLLTRHVKDRPAWHRLLQRVRQWCDRTRVMVRFSNGVCLEQMGSGPLHPTVAQQLQRQHQQRAMAAISRIGSGDAQVDASTSDAKLGDGAAWQDFVYEDDPATAHDAVMQQLAEKEHDVQWRNALSRCRERRHTSLADEWLVDDIPVAPAVSSERRTGRGKAAALEKKTHMFNHRAEDREAPPMLPWGTWDAGCRHSSVTSSLPGLGADAALQQLNQHRVPLPMSVTEEVPAKGLKAHALSNVSPPSVIQEGSSPIANLCARLETWGTGLTDDKEALIGEGKSIADSAAHSPTGAGGTDRDSCPARLTWKDSQRGSVLRCKRATPFNSHPDDPLQNRSTDELEGELENSVVVTSERALATPFLRPQRTSASQSVPTALTKIERELLSFVLICASGGGGREHLTVLLSLCRGCESEGIENGRRRDGATDAGGLAATQLPPALAALRTMLDRLSNSPNCDSAAAGAALAHEAGSSGAAETREECGVERASSLLSPRVPGEVSLVPRTSAVSGDADTDAGFTSVDHQLETAKTSAAATATEKVGPPWGALVTSLLSDYNALDLNFLRQLHLILLQYESLKHEGVPVTIPKVQESVGARCGQAPPLPIRKPSPAQGAQRAVCPLALHLSTRQESERATSTTFGRSARGPCILSTVLVDAADLLNAIAGTPLLRWLCSASRQSPTSGWAELVERVPETCASDWQNALARCIGAASSALASSSLVEARHWRSHSDTESAAATAPPYHPRQLDSFICDTASALANGEWRLRLLHDVLHRASALAEQDQYMASSGSAAGVDVDAPLAAGSGCGTEAAAFPCVGETPYLPGNVARSRYPLDMRNLYLMSALGVEDIDARVVVQLHEARSQYADALRAATIAATSVNASGRLLVSISSPLVFPKPATSLPLALQQRVLLDGLSGIEQRFFGLVSALWNLEQTIYSFNRHVAPFNAFTAAERVRWGSLYCSSLKVAYFVCEELAEKGMENVSMELLPFVSIVAAFTGCRGGHRELLSKLNATMLELCERAKRVQVPLESLSWQKKRPQVLAEAVEASKLSSRRAAAVVSCLATEADVVSPPLMELKMPALRLIQVPPLTSPPDSP
ncbi:hypothetical protein JKF63_04134 [Porcisia hertigi]|uniref:Uncharacterized protein n=1 Tax=Porcisia hertigi TaxID=2761500 RepID=A0A836I2R7_9TRYP|nr:hypothetical protein JKF63_04134 [Porcisia hertigi]